MIGLVAVSHSRPLAMAAVELALQMGGAAPPVVRVAAGGPDGDLGTDAVAIAAAIDEADSGDGVLVLMDWVRRSSAPRPPWSSWPLRNASA